MSDTQRGTEPHDRLTRLCNVMEDALRKVPGSEDVRSIIFLDDGVMGGISITGYETDLDAVAHLMGHIAAIFEVNGIGFDLIPVTGGPNHG